MLKVCRLFPIVLFVAAFCTFSSTAFAAKGPAKVTLKVAKHSFTANESVPIEVTISNPSRGAIRVLKWLTPAEDFEEPLFTVTRDGVPVEYLGPHYKRLEPSDRDFVVLKSGESFTRTVDLADYYDLSETGNYLVSYDVKSLDLYEKGNPAVNRVQELKSDAVQIWIEGRAAKVRNPDPPTAVTGSNSYVKCTTAQQPIVATARNEASAYSNNAWNYLLGNKQGARYTTWFGVYNSSRYSTVSNNFAKITNAMDTQQMTFNCGCKKNYYAYVYSNQPYNIYLCRVFWTAPMTGTDSKAGTLVHETSHFTVVAGTNDWVYGQSGAKSLAISDPNKAVDNADSHEYFAENTPAQN